MVKQLLACGAVGLLCVAAGDPAAKPADAQTTNAPSPLALKPEFDAALKRALELGAAWSGKATETTTDVQSKGVAPAEGPGVPTEVTVVVSGSRALLTPLASEGQLAAAVVDASGGWMRTAEGLSQRTAPTASLLWTLPVLLPTTSTLRVIDVATEDKWESIRKKVIDEHTVEYLIKTVVVRGGYGEYAFRFRTAGPKLVVSAIDWRIFYVEDGRPPEKGIEVTCQARAFDRVGEAEVPVAIERRAFLKDRSGTVRAHSLTKLVLSDLKPLSVEEASERIGKAIEPRIGESVSIEGRKLRLVIGEAWIEVAGVRFDTSDPIMSIPTSEELEKILSTAKQSQPTEASSRGG